MSSKKVNGLYTKDFKLKVLEYYFRHGGDSKFGLKSKTAHHFAIDIKTINRMLCKREIVKGALRLISKKHVKPHGTKSEGKEDEERIISSNIKQEMADDEDESHCLEDVHLDSREQSSEEAPVIELPEDPDFSVLKKTIDSSVSGVADIAKLLITGTDEVKRILTNECDLILECKVCRNLFRSAVNLLAHKRIYCLEEQTNVRSLYKKNTGYGVTSESPMVIIESDPPTDQGPSNSGGGAGKRELKIDKIASQLANKKSKGSKEVFSSSTNTGSSSYFNKLQEENEYKKTLNTSCAVLLQDIAGVSSAVYQTYIPPQSDKQPKESMQEAVKKHIHERKKETPVHLDAEGRVIEKESKVSEPTPSTNPTRLTPVKSEASTHDQQDQEIVSYPCNSCALKFTSKKLRAGHIEDVHGVERSIYTCPICNVIFLSIWGCVKHLIRVHKKKKHQRERLKHVICSRSHKKVFTTKDLLKLSHKSSVQIMKKREKESQADTSSRGAQKERPQSDISLRKETQDHPNAKTILSHPCMRCGQTFQTPGALGSHIHFCKVCPTHPEKKIGIQIRKDYKKESKPSCPAVKQLTQPPSSPAVKQMTQAPSFPTVDFSLEVQARIKEFCEVKRLFCMPCDRSYNSLTVLKRHTAQHLGWTRFSCAKCSFRCYEKYVCVQHCTTAHSVKPKDIKEYVKREDRLGTFNFYLPINSCISRKSENVLNKTEFDNVQNGHTTSPLTQDATINEIESEDSISLKGEIDNQDLDSADVAYRELIENVDMEKEVKTTNSNIVKIEIKDLNDIDSKTERPQRTRKVVEQKDFVYEPLRPTSSLSRSDDEGNGKPTSAISLRVKNVSSTTVVGNEKPGKRRGASPYSEPSKKRTNSSSLANSKEIKVGVAEHIQNTSNNLGLHHGVKPEDLRNMTLDSELHKIPKGAKPETTKETIVKVERNKTNTKSENLNYTSKSKNIIGAKIQIQIGKETPIYVEDLNKNFSQSQASSKTEKTIKINLESLYQAKPEKNIKINPNSQNQAKPEKTIKINPNSQNKAIPEKTVRIIIDSQNQAKPEKTIKIKHDSLNQAKPDKTIKINRDSLNQAKPEKTIKINRDSQNQAKPDKTIKINRDSLNQAKPEKTMKINRDSQNQVNKPKNDEAKTMNKNKPKQVDTNIELKNSLNDNVVKENDIENKSNGS